MRTRDKIQGLLILRACLIAVCIFLLFFIGNKVSDYVLCRSFKEVQFGMKYLVLCIAAILFYFSGLIVILVAIIKIIFALFFKKASLIRVTRIWCSSIIWILIPISGAIVCDLLKILII